MKLSTLFALFFAVGVIHNLFKATPDVSAALIWGLLALIPLLFGMFVTDAEAMRRAQFFEWLETHRGELLTGKAIYRGLPITPGTKVHSFTLVVSFFFFTAKTERGVYIEGVDSIAGPGIFFTLLSLVLGWWGLPFGPIYTVQALATNLGGGRVTTIADLMHRIPRQAAPAVRARPVFSALHQPAR